MIIQPNSTSELRGPYSLVHTTSPNEITF